MSLNANVLRLNEDRRQRRSGDLNLDVKVSRLTDVERSSVDNEFHTVGAATRKLLVPSFVRVLGTNRSPRGAERRLDRAVLLDTGTQTRVKYVGPMPRKQSKASKVTLN